MQRTTIKQVMSKRQWLGALGAIALFTGGCMSMMKGVPSDLDYSTARATENGAFRLSYKTDPALIPISKLHQWTIHLETPEGKPIDGATITVDGDMPQHGHGLPTRPEVTQNLGNGDYRVEGMKFQMGGWWIVNFGITADGKRDQATFNLMLK